MSSAADKPRVRPGPAEPEAEVELWWGGYSGWTMAPNFAVCAFLTAALIGGAWYLYSEEDVPGDRARYSVYALAAAIWFVQLYRWARRMATLNYRLTTRRLYHCRGLGVERVVVVDLAEVRVVQVAQTSLQRRLDVGQVRAETASTAIELTGVREPHRIAALMERQVQWVREACVAQGLR
jgi:membrane protein YdbS with pleckstrin-like domain